MLPPPLKKFLLFATFFLVGKDLMRQKGVRDQLEIRQIKKNAHEEANSRKKEKTDNRKKINRLLPKKNQVKFHQLWRQAEREKERLLHLQMKYKTKSINSSDRKKESLENLHWFCLLSRSACCSETIQWRSLASRS